MLKKHEVIPVLSEVDVCKEKDIQMYLDRNDAFFMKHSAEMDKGGFIFKDNMVLFAALLDLDTYFHYVGSGLEESTRKIFETVQKSF